MRVYSILLFLLLFALQATQAQRGFVQVKGQQFVVDGKPWYYIGANYWQGPILLYAKDPARGRERLLKELDFLQQHGVTNLRVLAAVEGEGQTNGRQRVKPTFQQPQGVFNSDALNGLDLLLAEMGKRNMKAVIFLGNNWEWTGGFLQYLNWNGLLPDSIMQRKLGWEEYRDWVSRFYTCEPCKEGYYKQVREIVGRTNSITKKPYRNDPAIMAWQLANEPRPMRPAAIEAYKNWIKQSAALIKSIDRNHLVCTGSEGEMGSENMETFRDAHRDKNIDYLTIHLWPKNWSWFSDTAIAQSMAQIEANTSAYIRKHEAIAKELNKPFVVEEVGLPRDRHSFDIAAPTTLRDQFYAYLFSAVASSARTGGALAGCNFWGFGGTGRPAKGTVWWSDGDDYLADPPAEEQGLNTVFDSDTSTWGVITRFTRRLNQQHKQPGPAAKGRNGSRLRK